MGEDNGVGILLSIVVEEVGGVVAVFVSEKEVDLAEQPVRVGEMERAFRHSSDAVTDAVQPPVAVVVVEVLCRFGKIVLLTVEFHNVEPSMIGIPDPVDVIG